VSDYKPYIPRAPRYQIEISLRYRPIGETIWRDGQSENVSRTGVLFRPERGLSLRTHVELLLEMPAELAAAAGVHVRRGRIVRSTGPSIRDDTPTFAAAAFDFDYFPSLDPRRI